MADTAAKIKRVAVAVADVMGGGIAAQMADAGVEVILLDLVPEGAKQDVYRKIDANRKSGSVVSSNTSTLPLATLTSGMAESFARDFMITHFFNWWNTLSRSRSRSCGGC